MNFGKISVIMGIYNCESTLPQAVESILHQTYSNWELIMCDDGSTDHTYEVARRLAEGDKRLVVIKNNRNCGLNRTLNNCLVYASGDYIARMDGDDVCVPERFEKQISFLNSQDEFDICSSAMFFFDENGRWGENNVKAKPQAEDIVKGSPICHAPVMMRKGCMDEVGGYTENPRMLRVEDVNLWIKLYVAGYKCYNISDPLYGMRNDKNALNRRKYKYRINEAYVRLLGCRELNVSWNYYIYALKPLIAGIIPAKVRMLVRKKQWSQQ